MGFFSDLFLDLACVHLHDGSSRNGGVARDKREEQDSRDVRDPKAEGRGSKFRTLQPSVFSLETASPVPLFPPVSPVSLGSEHQ